MRAVPAEVRIPPWLTVAVLASVAAGAALGFGVGGPLLLQRATRALFFGATFAYLTTATVDFWEHLRLEKAATGRWLAWQAVPPGESLNHGLTTVILVAMLLWVRRPPPVLEARDWLCLTAPAIFLALGWWDEVVYHRRRCDHREDLMHTISHLAGGVMLTALYLMRLLS
jgi:hypothetical protein